MRHYPKEKVICNTQDGMTFSVFHPSLFCLIPRNSGNLETEHGVKLRFFYRFLIGYRIYLLRADNRFIAYAMYQKGRIFRYPFVGKASVLMGPYFVDESIRGRGYAGRILELSLHQMKHAKSAIAWIAANNDSSRHALSKAGFHRIGWMDPAGIKKKTTQSPTNYELWEIKLPLEEGNQ